MLVVSGMSASGSGGAAHEMEAARRAGSSDRKTSALKTGISLAEPRPRASSETGCFGVAKLLRVEGYDTRDLRGCGPGGDGASFRDRAGRARLPGGGRRLLAAGRGQPAQQARQRPQPAKEPYRQHGHPPPQLGVQDHVLHPRPNRGTPHPDTLPSGARALRAAGVVAPRELPGLFLRLRCGLRLAHSRRRAQHPRRAALLASGQAVPALARRRPERRECGNWPSL